MNTINIKENELPWDDMESIGLAAGGQLLLNIDDLKSLLSGRRTGLLQLHNLEAENVKIKSMDAKVSLNAGKNGKMDLLIHPIYKRVTTPDFMDDFQADMLKKGDVPNLLVKVKDGKGDIKEMLVEYDKDTNEFIVSDTEKILVPDMVNNEFLTPAQKEKYRKGQEVELADRTVFNYSATDPHGIKANKLALIASILIDGGLTYVVYKGLNALFNKKRDEKAAASLSPGYHNAMKDIENQRGDIPNQVTRSYSRGGSR